jgi:hypothetical protein
LGVVLRENGTAYRLSEKRFGKREAMQIGLARLSLTRQQLSWKLEGKGVASVLIIGSGTQYRHETMVPVRPGRAGRGRHFPAVVFTGSKADPK